jgi:glycerol-3-phosphate acyltransferase PlsY
VPAFLTFSLDVAKTLAAVLPVAAWGEWAQASAGIGVVAGHNWSPWLRFRGGRGIGEILVVALVISPKAGLLYTGILALGLLTRRLGLLAGLGLVVLPVAAGLWNGGPAGTFATVALVLAAARRLQGSPEVSGSGVRGAFKDRLLFDREPQT